MYYPHSNVTAACRISAARQAKINRNRERDLRNYDELMHAGWQVIVIWACYLTKDKLESTMQTVAVTLNKNLLNIL